MVTSLTDTALILASSSPYRRELLGRLGLPFEVIEPEVDERRLPDEEPATMVARLAAAKADAVVEQRPGTLIIGSDQVAAVDHHVLGKPGNAANALVQLRALSGKRVDFLTGLCLLNGASGRRQTDVVVTSVFFRNLSDDQIAGYVAREQPYGCSGAFKSEGLGIALVDRFAGDDPTALIGLPLIRLTDMLNVEGVPVLTI